MGKGRNKNKDKEGCATVGGAAPRRKEHEDYYDSDSDESVSTHLTFDDDMKSVRGDIEGDDETFLDTLSEHIDNAGHKNIGVRLAALRHLQFALTSQYLAEFVTKWKSTLIDLASKGIKKTDEEVVVCATLLSLISIQIGEDISDDIEEPLTALRVIVADPTRSELIRAHCALCLSITTYISSESDESVALSVKALRLAWTTYKVSSTNYKLFSNAMAGWCLLLQNADSATVSTGLQDETKVVTYLEASTVDVRIAAGEALAFLYEFAESVRPGFSFSNNNSVVDILSGLITDSSKAKTKRDKRVQKLSFRQISSFIVNGDFPELKIKFTNQESLVLDSCSKKLFYDMCTDLLHGGMMRQLRDNELLREIFELGAPAPDVAQKMAKSERIAIHDAATKNRNQQRGKQRDKRAAAVY